MTKILVTGALGQIGSELTTKLGGFYGSQNIIVTDKRPQTKDFTENCQFKQLDVTKANDVANIISEHQIDTIYHLAALLSATAEKKPRTAWQVNMYGLYNILELAREYDCSVFTPSSIGAFGPNTPKHKTPQETIQRPNTMYGVTKVAGELLCDYYHTKYGVDTRGLRYPGIVSHKTLPGGGTTDYAVDIFYAALKTQKYDCFLNADSYLDMMYMPDAIQAAIQLMESNPEQLKHRNAFNVTAMSICPQDLATEIQKYLPRFKIRYSVDPERQAIADSWPDALDDSAARQEWNWEPEYDLKTMTRDMLQQLALKLNIDIELKNLNIANPNS